MRKYKAYQPSKWETRIDNAIALLAPTYALGRTMAREKAHYFRYIAARPNGSRRNANSNSSGETMRGSREKLQLMWNAIETVDNSGLCGSLLQKLMTYVCGSLRYQARTGDKSINNEYESFLKSKFGKAIDYTGRCTLRQMAMLDVKSIALKGDVGCNVVREGSELYLQGIEADRIGDPYSPVINNNYVRGISLNDSGAVIAYNIYRRDRVSGRYTFDMSIPARSAAGLPRFLFSQTPLSYDDVRGVTLFKTAIDNASYLEQMRRYELQALLWAASQSGIFKTKSGLLPEGMPFDTNENEIDTESGQLVQSFTVRPNTVTAIGTAEDVEMFQHDRPSPNVIAMYNHTIKDIAIGAGFSYGFAYEMTGLSGPAVRFHSSQDKRAIQAWQANLEEDKLNPIKTLMLGNAIANGELQFHPRWNEGQWFYPPHPTIDVGRESTANINENAAALNSGAAIAAENQQDIEEIHMQCGLEAENIVEIAIDTANRINKRYKLKESEALTWRETLPMIRRGGAIVMSPEFEAARAAQLDAQVESTTDASGATTDGTQMP